MKKIIVIGAGPAGLTLAYELLNKGPINLKIYEADKQVGGISKTICYNENRIDIGGHRFFSKSTWVMNWWSQFMPWVSNEEGSPITLSYQGSSIEDPLYGKSGPLTSDGEMLVRDRISRIYFNRQFFSYPLQLNLETLKKLGFGKSMLFGVSYVYSKIFPVRPENSLEDFFINRFGKKLYHQFFREYTEKVWGVSCSRISASWGAQRIKSLSILQAILHAISKSLGLKRNAKQTSLIEHFLYPKYGPGQMWEIVSEKIISLGGQINLGHSVIKIEIKNGKVRGIKYRDSDGNEFFEECTHLVSTMPIKELVNASPEYWGKDILKIANGLQYRDFITVGLLYDENNFPEKLIDNWIYIQEPGVFVGRVQIFNNWSPFLVGKAGTVWLGLEFFCTERDNLWKMSDDDLRFLAQKEIYKIGLVDVENAMDGVVIKVPKAYPGYFGQSYSEFDVLREELDAIENLFLIGRNGMHRYNNQDHSMLTAKEAAEQILSNKIEKHKIWEINVGDDYHEEK